MGGAENLVARLVQHMEEDPYQPMVCRLVSGSLTKENTSDGIVRTSLFKEA